MTEENDSSVEQGSEVEEILHNKEFGAPLREAREKAGLSIADVAHSLLISENIISAIENSQMDKLPSATFVIGYIRGYARILDVSADDAIAAYNSMLPAAKNEMSPSPFVPEEQKDTSNKAAIVMALSIILLLLIAWLFQSDTVPNSEESYEPENISNFGSLDVDSHNVQQIEIDSAELIDEPLSDFDAALLDKLEVADEALPVTDNDLATQVDELILTALGESWCEVFDATGKRLFYRLMVKNEEEKIYGQAPFKVFLGAASKIRIEVNNKIVNFEHLIVSKKNIANIIVSENSEVTSGRNR